MDTTRLTADEQAIVERLERWDRPGMATTINLGQALTDIRTALATIAGLREQLQARTRCNHDNFEAYKGDCVDFDTQHKSGYVRENRGVL